MGGALSHLKIVLTILRNNTLYAKEIKCSFRVKMCYSFVGDVLSLPLGNYDLVLGIQWLVKLKDIWWNFKKLQMRFKVGSEECKL